jgi:ATP-dependent DNA helicase RecG
MLSIGIDLQELLDRGMGTDLQWFPEDVPISQLAGVLVAMANTHGGIILLGITPRSAQVLGVSNPEEAIDRIFQAALLSDPPLVLPIPKVYAIDRAKVVRVVVPPGLPHVFNLDGSYLERSGNQNNPLPARRLRALLMERGIIQFETRCVPEARQEDLDQAQVEAYIEVLQPITSEKAEDVLVRRGCLQMDAGVLRPTYAGLLLFGRHPQQWLPNATIMATRFPGTAYSDQFIKQEIRGTLPDQLRQAEVFVRDNLRSVVRVVGLMHQETPEYPLEAVRELLVNAVAHRDYNQQGDSIHLHIFSDRLEVRSPGKLPGPVNLENLLVARFSRNAVIAQVLSDLGFVERLGYGLNRVVTILKQNDLSAPKFEEVGGAFRVTLYSSAANLFPQADLAGLSTYSGFDFNPRQERALGYLTSHKRISNSDYQELCTDVSAETLRRDLAALVKSGILIKVGDKRATYYIRKK